MRRKRLIRRMLAAALAASLLLFLACPACSPRYIAHVGTGQAKILFSSEPLTEALLSRDLSKDETDKLLLIRDAKAFAEDRLGLRRTSSYTKVAMLDREHATWVVSAAPLLSLRHHTWWFPVVGRVPYKGFFSQKLALAEADRLRRKGLDVYVGTAEAYSTLGWFSDPVFSTWFRKSRGQLANLVIHELVHATLYIKGNGAFNEGFASFVGDQGAMLFLAERFGPESGELREAIANIDDNRLFSEFIDRLFARLAAVYALEEPEAERLKKKKEVIESARSEFRALLPRMKTKRYHRFGATEWNNATVLAHRLYYRDRHRFAAAHAKFGGDLRTTVARFVALAEETDAPLAAIEKDAGPGPAVRDGG